MPAQPESPEQPKSPASIEKEVFITRQDNIAVLLHNASTGTTLAIDAPDAVKINEVLKTRKWRLNYILITHTHADHIAGVEKLKADHGCKVYAPKKSNYLKADETVKQDDKLNLGQMKATIWETPGHSSDHVTYWFKDLKLFFAGDVLFTMGCGRVENNQPDNYTALWQSLQKIKKLEPKTSLFGGHDYTKSNARFAKAAEPENQAILTRAHQSETEFLIPTTLECELATNPFLRAGNEDSFKALREWKNNV